jgi:hypothetical protein
MAERSQLNQYCLEVITLHGENVIRAIRRNCEAYSSCTCSMDAARDKSRCLQPVGPQFCDLGFDVRPPSSSVGNGEKPTSRLYDAACEGECWPCLGSRRTRALTREIPNAREAIGARREITTNTSFARRVGHSPPGKKPGRANPDLRLAGLTSYLGFKNGSPGQSLQAHPGHQLFSAQS